MKPHSRTQLKTRTRVLYNSRIAEVCEIIDEEYTSLALSKSGDNNQSIPFIRAVDKYQLSPIGERRVREALGLIWGWYIGRYIIVRPVNVEEYR